MRLLAVSHTGLFSGAEVVLVRTLEGAKQRGWDVRCAAPRGDLADALAEIGVPHIELPELKLPGGPRAAAGLLLAARSFAAARVLRRASTNADLVLVNGLLALPALRLARPRPPVAWLAHDVVLRRSLLALVRACRPVVKLAIGVSESVARPLRKIGLRTQVVLNGTAWPVDRATPATDPRRIGCAGLITPWKGQAVLLDAFALMAREGLVLDLVGGSFPKDLEYLDQLKQRAARPDLAGRVRFLGRVPDVLDVMRTWSVAVVGSIEPDAGPLTVLEAMSVGVPVVATDQIGIPEVLAGVGRMVPHGHATAMADAIAAVLDQGSEERARRVEEGRRRIEEGFSLERRRSELLDVLEGVASRRGRDAGGAA